MPRDLQIVQQTSEAHEEGPVIKMQHMNKVYRNPKFTQSKYREGNEELKDSERLGHQKNQSIMYEENVYDSKTIDERPAINTSTGK